MNGKILKNKTTNFTSKINRNLLLLNKKINQNTINNYLFLSINTIKPAAKKNTAATITKNSKTESWDSKGSDSGGKEDEGDGAKLGVDVGTAVGATVGAGVRVGVGVGEVIGVGIGVLVGVVNRLKENWFKESVTNLFLRGL